MALPAVAVVGARPGGAFRVWAGAVVAGGGAYGGTATAYKNMAIQIYAFGASAGLGGCL